MPLSALHRVQDLMLYVSYKFTLNHEVLQQLGGRALILESLTILGTAHNTDLQVRSISAFALAP